MIYIKNETTRQTLYIPSTLDAVDGAIRLRLYNVIDNTEHIQGVSQGANSGGGAYNLDFDFSFLVDGGALLSDYNSDFNNDYAIMTKGATKEDIYYVVSINLPNRLQSGEYEYALLTEDNRHIATGIAIVGEYKNSNNQYNRYEEEYQQYGG